MGRIPGKKQKQVLRSIAMHSGNWSAGSGWLWDSVGGTNRLMLSLVRYGYVANLSEDVSGTGKFQLTEAGAQAAHAMFPEERWDRHASPLVLALVEEARVK